MLSFTVATEGDKDASQAIVISVTFSDMFPFSVHHPASWRAWQTWKSLDLLKLCICVNYYNNMQLRVFKSESAMSLNGQLTTLSSNIPLSLINGMEKLRKKNCLATQYPNSPYSGLKIQHSTVKNPIFGSTHATWQVAPRSHRGLLYTIKVVTEPHPWRSCHSGAASGWKKKITLTSNLVEIQECPNEARKFTLHHMHQK